VFNTELAYGHQNSCTRSAYYVWFHVAIAALIQAALTSPAPRLPGEDPAGIYIDAYTDAEDSFRVFDS
jgi:hypothetical protein